MEIPQIPFNKHVNISYSSVDDSILEMRFDDTVKNHLGTFHASAQFALAEACSGLCLQESFPHLTGSVIPVLRKSEVKFKKPAQSDIRASATLSQEMKDTFEIQLERKGRATISILVDIICHDHTITMTGRYEWFVQKM